MGSGSRMNSFKANSFPRVPLLRINRGRNMFRNMVGTWFLHTQVSEIAYGSCFRAVSLYLICVCAFACTPPPLPDLNSLFFSDAINRQKWLRNMILSEIQNLTSVKTMFKPCSETCFEPCSRVRKVHFLTERASARACYAQKCALGPDLDQGSRQQVIK